MKEHFKHHFFPHEDNDHKPHFLRDMSVAILVVVIVAVFGFTAFQSQIVNQNANFLAAVLPGVLTDITNEDREEHDLPPLTLSEKLTRAAQMKANHMAENGYLAHFSPTGETPWTWIRKAGYSYAYAGENLAVNFADSQDVARAWMNSPLHRENILSPHYTQIGIATAKGEYKGQETVFVVQMFAAPAANKNSSNSAQAENNGEIAGTRDTDTAVNSTAQDSSPPAEENAQKEETKRRIAHADGSSSVTKSTIKEDSQAQAIESSTSSTGESAAQSGMSTGSPAGSMRNNGGSAPHYSSPLMRLSAQPQTMMQIMYLTLAVIISFSMAATVGIEYKKQHPKHVIYAMSLLVMIITFTYLGQLLLFPQVTIL